MGENLKRKISCFCIFILFSHLTSFSLFLVCAAFQMPAIAVRQAGQYNLWTPTAVHQAGRYSPLTATAVHRAVQYSQPTATAVHQAGQYSQLTATAVHLADLYSNPTAMAAPRLGHYSLQATAMGFPQRRPHQGVTATASLQLGR